MADLDQMYDAAVELHEKGDVEGAVAKLRELLDVNEEFAFAHAALGVYLHKLDQLDEAVKHATRVTELEPEDPFAFTQLSIVCQRCGRIREAEEAMGKAATLQRSQM